MLGSREIFYGDGFCSARPASWFTSSLWRFEEYCVAVKQIFKIIELIHEDCVLVS